MSRVHVFFTTTLPPRRLPLRGFFPERVVAEPKTAGTVQCATLSTRLSLRERPMNRLHSIVAVFPLLFLCVILVATAQNQFTVDATMQPSPPPRARGPFPGSPSPGHSVNLPIRLELLFRTGDLRPDGTALVDFVITNVAPKPIILPSSADQNIAPMAPKVVLTLWLTSDAIKDQFFRDTASGRLVKFEIVGTSAELYGSSDVLQSFHELAPNESMLVHASSRVQLDQGMKSFTGHAELLQVSNGSKLIGTADSTVITQTLSIPSPTAR